VNDNEKELNQLALELWKKMQGQIRKEINKVILFNTCLEVEDYFSEAFIACRKAVEKYQSTGRGGMQLKVFAHWYVMKAIHRAADMKEVVFLMYSPKGEYVKTVTNGEYRKLKKELGGQGYKFRSTKIVTDESEIDNKTNSKEEEDS
jgi:DNA-directed RNA polymerase specialized sigma subunit